jgi:hypothetical protein
MNGPSQASVQMLLALNRLGKPMYEGTVPRKVVAKRRAANKRSGLSRRVNREA